jgi:hypothetical protein
MSTSIAIDSQENFTLTLEKILAKPNVVVKSKKYWFQANPNVDGRSQADWYLLLLNNTLSNIMKYNDDKEFKIGEALFFKNCMELAKELEKPIKNKTTVPPELLRSCAEHFYGLDDLTFRPNKKTWEHFAVLGTAMSMGKIRGTLKELCNDKTTGEMKLILQEIANDALVKLEENEKTFTSLKNFTERLRASDETTRIRETCIEEMKQVKA